MPDTLKLTDAIRQEDGRNLSFGSLRTLKLIDDEYKSLKQDLFAREAAMRNISEWNTRLLKENRELRVAGRALCRLCTIDGVPEDGFRFRELILEIRKLSAIPIDGIVGNDNNSNDHKTKEG